MTKKRRHGRHRRREAERMQTAVLAGAAVLLIAVVTVVVLILRCCGGKAETAAREAGAETEASETETEALPESGDGGEAESGTQTAQTEALSGTEGETSVPEESAVKSTVAAEVGSMDDEQDPQSGANAAGTGTGASVDLNTLAKAEGETDEVTLGIDVSKYQGSIDWEQVAQSGVEFAMIRVGYRTKVTGIIYEDPGARYNLQEAAKNGILVGAYFFSSAVSEEEAREEAAWVADFIARYPVTYPVAYNCEDFQSPDSRQYGLGSEERTRIACAFLDTVAAAGYTPMFYASRNEMEGNAQWNMDTLGSRYRVWVSQYPEQPYPETAASTYSGTHAMWQYTSTGKVNGINGNVDLNECYRDFPSIIKAAGLNGYAKEAGSTPAPAPEPESGGTYTVKAGDSWWKIAEEQLGDGTRYKELAEYNGKTAASVIHPGDVLKLP